MDLNHIQLQGAQVAGWYPESLVELEGDAAIENIRIPEGAPSARIPAEAPQAATAFLGQHGKKILLVNDDAEAVYISDADLEVLTKIMDRAGLSLADIAIVNWARLPSKDGNALLSELGSGRVLLLGVTPDQFGLAAVFPHFQVQKLAGRTFLAAPPVATLAAAENAVKTNFWNAFRTWLS